MGCPVYESRVLRGGSWNNDQDNARAAYRNHNHPGNRNNNLGFRALCLAHIVSPLHKARGSGKHPQAPLRALAGQLPSRASGIGRRPRFAARGEGQIMARSGPARTLTSGI